MAYIKFSKTSEAARALEEMNGKLIGKSQRPIKVLVASRSVFLAVHYIEDCFIHIAFTYSAIDYIIHLECGTNSIYLLMIFNI